MSARSLASLIALVAAAGCGGETVDLRGIPIVLDFAGADRSELERYLVGVYQRESCGFVQGTALESFDELTDAETRLFFDVFPEGSASEIGELPAGSYAFVGMGLESCEPAFVGCEVVDVTRAESITLRMEPASGESICNLFSAQHVCVLGVCQNPLDY